MNKSELIEAITSNVSKKHPHKVSQERYVQFFGELSNEYLNERLAYDNLVEKAKGFKILHLVLTETKLEVRLNIDQCIAWEIGRWEDAARHNIVPNDIKKRIKQREHDQ